MKDEGVLRSMLVEMNPEKNYYITRGFKDSYKDLTGTLSFYTITGTPGKSMLMQEGRFKKQILRLNKLSSLSPIMEEEEEAYGRIEIELDEVVVVAHRNETPYQYVYIYIPLSTYNQNPSGGVYNGWSWSPASSGSGGTTPTNPVQLFNSEIDYSRLPTCLQTVMSSVKNLSNGSVGQILTKFSGQTPGYNWIVSNGILEAGTNAVTNSTYDRVPKTVRTTFDVNKFTAATDLSIARTIVHESVHAYLVTYFGTDPVNANDVYSNMIQDWVSAKNPNLNTIQHDEIVRSFIGDIAISLKEFGANKGYNLPSQFYADLAWGGLTATRAFKALSAADKLRINNVILAEQAGVDVNGNPVAQKGNLGGCQ